MQDTTREFDLVISARDLWLYVVDNAEEFTESDAAVIARDMKAIRGFFDRHASVEEMVYRDPVDGALILVTRS